MLIAVSKSPYAAISVTTQTVTTLTQSTIVGMDLALDGSGWMMSVVLVLNHVSPPVQTEELDHTTVAILRMWQFIVTQEHVPVCLICLIDVPM